MSDVVAELRRELAGLTPEELAEFDQMAREEISRPWTPDPRNKPQVEAYYSPADILLYGGQAGGGKALALDTPLPTPTGWTSMGEVSVGDWLLGDDGKPCQVAVTSPVMFDRTCYRLRFSDGVEIVADADHRWWTETDAERDAQLRSSEEWRARRRANREPRGCGKRPDLAARNAATAGISQKAFGGIRTTQEIAESLTVKGGRTNHAVPVASPADLPAVELPLDPYLLGAWLGDGSSHKAEITTADPEVLAQFHAAGFQTRARTPITFGVYGLLPILRAEGLLANKHIPLKYLRASIEQRRALLQGLMDTDGYADPRGACEFTSMRPALAHGTAELLASLGVKATIAVGRATLQGRDCGEKYRIKFVAPFPAFRLERKLTRQKIAGLRQTTQRRYIESVDPVESVPVKCVAVNSASRLYLASKAFIPTHNTDLLIGCATTAHEKAVIFRNQYGDLKGIEQRILEIYPRKLWNAGDYILKLPKGQMLELGALWKPGAEMSWQGRPHDFIGFDEGAQISLAKVAFVIGWLRSVNPGQRKRVIIASNPPVGGEGDYLVEWFAPWLDPLFAVPARPGELRWAVMSGAGKTVWVDGPGEFPVPGEDALRRSLSRTFIPAGLKDNAFLAGTGYEAQLDSLPEPLRTKLKTGDFMVGRQDHEFQVIPTAWVEAAQARWAKGKPAGSTMAALGVDVAQGGLDKTVIARLWSNWFDELLSYPGAVTPDGPAVAGLVVAAMRGAPEVAIDLTGGWGISARDHLVRNRIEVAGVVFSGGSNARTRDGKLGYLNKRAELWWRFREALDPDANLGDEVALPPSRVLKAQLTTPRWKLRGDNILVESKDDIRLRLGSSTDEADAVIMAWSRRAYFVQRKKIEAMTKAGGRFEAVSDDDPFASL